MANWQVSFKETRGSSDLSAVHVDRGSIYVAEDTYFEGFEGEVGDWERTSLAPIVKTVTYAAMSILVCIASAT